MPRSPWIGLVRQVAARAGLGLAALGGLAATAPAQEAGSPAADSPARFCPKDGHLIFVEFDGLDAHAEAWKKTAAYKILNDTTTGAMLEDLFQQVFNQYLNKPTGVSGGEALQLLKHLARAGFLVDLTIDPADPKAGQFTVVLRDAFGNKDIRPVVGRLLQKLPAAGAKPQPVVVAGHKLISVATKPNNGRIVYWWVEESKKKDILLVAPVGRSMEAALEVVDGKQPSMLDNPRRAELAGSLPKAERTAMVFLDPGPTRALGQATGMARLLDSAGVDRLDVAAGLQGDALLTVARIHPRTAEAADSPVAKALAAASGPGFDKGAIGAIPPGVVDFAVASIDPSKLLDQVPQLKDQWDDLMANSREKSKLRLQEDVLAHLGPKLIAYSMPAKAGAAAGGLALPNALNALTAPGGLPRFAIVVDVKNPAAFGKGLDELMALVNRGLKAKFTPPPVPGAPAAPRGRGAGSPPAPEFRVMPGEAKSYVLNVPSELASSFPAGFRPTIRVGPKQVAIAPSADLARQALEVKGSYTPPAEVADAYNGLPGGLKWLSMVDPRDTTPQVLAGLPAKLQTGINTMMLGVAGSPTGDKPAAGAAGAAGSPPSSASPSIPGPKGRLGMAGPGRPMAAGADDGGPAPTPGATNPAPGTSSPAPGTGSLVLQVDPAKLPSADAIRGLLFPSLLAVDQEAGFVRITSRTAFPNIPDPSVTGLAAVAGYRAGFAAARARAGGELAPPPGAAPPTSPPPGR